MLLLRIGFERPLTRLTALPNSIWAACTTEATACHRIIRKQPNGFVLRQTGTTGDAQFFLAVLLQGGKGVPQDEPAAVRLYQKAADQGNAQAQLYVAHMHWNGWYVSQNYAEAAKWYRLAAEQGIDDADTISGSCT